MAIEIKLVYKDSDDFKLATLELPAGSDMHYFENLKHRVETETDEIRNAMREILKKYPETSLSKPFVEDKNDKFKIDKLIEARRLNLDSINFINELLNLVDCIVCNRCLNLAYKTPINVPYEKVGKKYIIKVKDNEPVKYIYCCEKCNNAISEEIHEIEMKNKRLREELIKAGESFIPNEFGFWHWENDKKKTKPEGLNEEKSVCNHIYERNYETYKIPTDKHNVVKISQKCIYCGQVENLR